MASQLAHKLTSNSQKSITKRKNRKIKNITWARSGRSHLGGGTFLAPFFCFPEGGLRELRAWNTSLSLRADGFEPGCCSGSRYYIITATQLRAGNRSIDENEDSYVTASTETLAVYLTALSSCSADLYVGYSLYMFTKERVNPCRIVTR